MTAPYELNQCALYAVRSKGQLARFLNRALPYLRRRIGRTDLYRTWHEPKKSGGYRVIDAPRQDLKEIQRRIADLLQRVLPPEYLFSPVKGKSYVENALVHSNASEIRLLDVVDYFGSCTFAHVFRFFERDMDCSRDVAWMLTQLTTHNGRLPQGSPCSPILAFFSARSMWAEIAKKVANAGCYLTVYVDDITISGDHVPERLIWDVKRILRKHGHRHSKRKEQRRHNRSAEITGLVVHRGKTSVPYRHHLKLKRAREAYLKLTDETDRSRELSRIKSLEAQIRRLRELPN